MLGAVFVAVGIILLIGGVGSGCLRWVSQLGSAAAYSQSLHDDLEETVEPQIDTSEQNRFFRWALGLIIVGAIVLATGIFIL